MRREEADLIDHDENGNERWYQQLWVGGQDEDGVYERVLDGPAEGEKVYAR